MKSIYNLTLAFLAASTMSFGAHPKIARDLEVNADGNATVIIQFTGTPTARHHQMVKAHGGTHRADLGAAIKGGAYSISRRALEALANDPDVAYITPDRPVHGLLDYANSTVGADVARGYGFTGAGIGVAVIDSGIDKYSNDLTTGNTGSVVYSQSFLPNANPDADDYGHGTHVAGILAGNAYMSTGSYYTATFRGIAPAARIVNLRVLDSNGYGTDSGVIAAIAQAIILKSQYNIRIINLSLGRPVRESYTSDPLCQAVESAWRAGIVVVVAAGNGGRDNFAGTNGYGTIASPANDPYVITVGAMKTMQTAARADDQIASYSSKGPALIDNIVKPDLVAPGNRIVSLLAKNSMLGSRSTGNLIPYSYYTTKNGNNNSLNYYRLSGTSMAAPMVSGAAALLLQKDGTLTPDAVKARLMKTATKSFPSFSTAIDPTTGISYTSQYDIFTIGAGYLDIWAALNNTDTVSAGMTAMSPMASYNPQDGKVYLVCDSSALWGTSALWGNSALWGTNVFVSGTSALWGNSALWGSSGTQGFSALWGNSALWGVTSQTSAESLQLLVNGEN